MAQITQLPPAERSQLLALIDRVLAESQQQSHPKTTNKAKHNKKQSPHSPATTTVCFRCLWLFFLRHFEGGVPPLFFAASSYHAPPPVQEYISYLTVLWLLLLSMTFWLFPLS
jgi:hypothetical protein